MRPKGDGAEELDSDNEVFQPLPPRALGELDMDFSWTAEQLALRADIVESAQAELNGGLVEGDISAEFDRSKWNRVAELGILGSIIPEEFGGRGWDVMTTVLALEGLGYGCRDNGLTLAVNGQIWTVQQPILRFGTEEQKSRFLPGLCSGELLGAHALTEPDSGSDSYALATTALPTGSGYVLNGVKSFIGMGPICDVALVFANTNPDHGQWGISAFLIEPDTAGCTRGTPRSKMGLRTIPMGDLRFDDCVVPESARLGPEGAGVSISGESLEWERSLIFTSHLGSMERQLEETVHYARNRKQFGKPIGQFQSVSNRVADMRLRLDTAKLLLYRAAWLKSLGNAAQIESAMAKLYFAEAFLDSSLDAVRVSGGRGYVTEAEVERDLRDAVGGVLYGGTSDIQRQIISRLLGL